MRWSQVLVEAMREHDGVRVHLPVSRRERRELAERFGFDDPTRIAELFPYGIFVRVGDDAFVLDPVSGEALDAAGDGATVRLATEPRVVEALEEEESDAASSLLARALRTAEDDAGRRRVAHVVLAERHRAEDVAAALEEEPEDAAPALDALALGATTEARQRMLGRVFADVAARATAEGAVPRLWYRTVPVENALEALDEAAAGGADPLDVAGLFDARRELLERVELPDGPGADAVLHAAPELPDAAFDDLLHANLRDLVRDTERVVRALASRDGGDALLDGLVRSARRHGVEAVADAIEAVSARSASPAEDGE